MTDKLVHAPVTFETDEREGVLPVPEGKVLHRLEHVEWRPDSSLVSDDVHYAVRDPADVKPPPSKAWAIIVDTDTGAYRLNPDLEGPPFRITYQVAEVIA